MQQYLQNLFGFEVLPVTVPFPSTWLENASTIAITAVFRSILPIWMRLVECRSFLTRGQLYIGTWPVWKFLHIKVLYLHKCWRETPEHDNLYGKEESGCANMGDGVVFSGGGKSASM